MYKKLILFSYDFPPSNGGIARLCQEIAVRANLYYDSVYVLTRKKNGINIPYNHKDVNIIELPNKRIACEFAAIKHLRKIKNKKNIDVLCGIWHPEAILSFLSGFKNVYILGHGAEFLCGKSIFRKFIWLPVYAHLMLNKAKKVITNSHYTANLVNKITNKANIIPIPLAVNHNFFKPLNIDKGVNSKLKLCSVSRIEQFKGHDFVINAINSMPENYKDRIEFHIAGKGSFLSQLQTLIKKLNLENQVFFHNFIPDKELPVFYNQSDIFILCTREDTNSTAVEGFGLVFLEAQSCGIPAIGTRTGGIPDAIHEKNGGWLIEQDNTEELSFLLMQMIDNPILIQQMGEKARERVEDMATWDIYCKELFKQMSI